MSYNTTTRPLHRHSYDNLGHLCRMLARPDPAEQPPRIGAYHEWDCGCQFRYLCGGWVETRMCNWHRARPSMTTSAREVAA